MPSDTRSASGSTCNSSSRTTGSRQTRRRATPGSCRSTMCAARTPGAITTCAPIRTSGAVCSCRSDDSQAASQSVEMGDSGSCGPVCPLVYRGRHPRPRRLLNLFKKAVNDAMRTLAGDPRTVFVGQSVKYDGAAVYDSLAGVPMDRRIEMPVIEDFQLGFCTGLALKGQIPICIYPRMDFLLLAANQLVNHLDKLPLFGWDPKVIIRTMVGQKTPLDAGPQHTQNHAWAFYHMLERVEIIECRHPEDIAPAYSQAMDLGGSYLIVEDPA